MNAGSKAVPQGLICIGALWFVLTWGLSPGVLTAADQITLTWDPVPSRLVAGYRVHYGLQSRSYDVHLDVGKDAIVHLSGLADGTLYFFAVTAYTAHGYESDYSQEIFHVTPGTNAVSPYVQIVGQPRQQAVALGNSVTLRVTATGGGTLSYQWLKDGASLSGERSPHLAIDAAEAGASGRYSVVVTNELGTVVSHEAALRVIIPPQVESADRLSDGSIRLTIGNSDASPLSAFQVFRFGVDASIDPHLGAAWTPLTNAWYFENGDWLLKDPESPNMPQRYYRSVDLGGSIGDLRMELPERMANGNLRLRARLDSGTRALTPGEAAKLQFEAADDPGDIWMPLAGTAEWVEGEVVSVDAESTLRSKRFYRTVVQQADPPTIRLQALLPDSDRMVRLRLGRSDGRPLTVLDVLNYEVWVKTNLTSTSWQMLTNPMTLSNGKLIVDDAAAATSPTRFYSVYAR